MEKMIIPLNWHAELHNTAGVDSVDNDFAVVDKPLIRSGLDYPFKLDVSVAIICTAGTLRGTINLKSYTVKPPCLILILPGQILQSEYISDDFAGRSILMSRKFTDNLNIQDRLPLFLSVNNNPTIPLTNEELEAMAGYYSILQRVIRIEGNPNRMEIIKHITLAFFYGLGHLFHNLYENNVKSKQDVLAERFLTDVQANFRQQRAAEFYAGKLCLTPKYLSKVVKESSGMSASEWIDNYVVLEAKALLKSTNMTIQQISDELNFPSQSFFGKYFKRHVGVSPKEYRKS